MKEGLSCVPALLTVAGALYAQTGILNHIEGDALRNGYQIMVRPGEVPRMREGDEFRAGKGHQEVLLGPGVFLRVGSDSAFRLVAAAPAKTEIEFQAGSAIVECAGLPKHGRIAITLKTATVLILKVGVYRVDAGLARLTVYDGEARVLRDGQARKIGKGRQLALDAAAPVPGKFDEQTGDPLYLWAKMRSQHLAAATLATVRHARGIGASYPADSWVWNPSYRAYTFLPLTRTRKNIWGTEFHGLRDAVVQGTGADSLSASRQWAEAVAGAKRQAEWDCMTLEVRAAQMQ